MAEFFKLMKDTILQIQEALTTTPNKYTAKILRDIVVKQLKTKDKVKNIKTQRKKDRVSIKGAIIRLKA